MSTPKGRSILVALGEFASRGWYVKDFTKLVAKFLDVFQHRNEVISGGIVTEGTGTSASVLKIDTTDLVCVLDGRIKATLTGQNDLDLFTTGGAASQAIYTDGRTAAAISLASGKHARVAVIAHNSVGDGTVENADNGSGVKLMAVVAGTSSTYDTKIAPPTSVEIQAALDAAIGVHAPSPAGTPSLVSWVWLAHIDWFETGPTVTTVLNRNNVALDL